MQPGRELDALVAEMVIGYRRSFESKDNPGLWYFEKDGFSVKPHEIPEYSTDIAAAWQLLEKLSLSIVWDGSAWACANAKEITVSVSANGEDTQPVVIGVGFLVTDLPTIARADTAPHAICLAALKFIEGQT